jgi:hypothetical protein
LLDVNDFQIPTTYTRESLSSTPLTRGMSVTVVIAETKTLTRTCIGRKSLTEMKGVIKVRDSFKIYIIEWDEAAGRHAAA